MLEWICKVVVQARLGENREGSLCGAAQAVHITLKGSNVHASSADEDLAKLLIP